MTTFIISSGVNSSSQTIAAGDTLEVLSGGYADV